jgi:hypothetical protein
MLGPVRKAVNEYAVVGCKTRSLFAGTPKQREQQLVVVTDAIAHPVHTH